MPAHSRSWGFRGGLPPGVFSSSLRDVVTIGRHASPFRGERAIFLMSAGLCRLVVCAGVLSLSLSVGAGRFPTTWGLAPI
jgi:hypothetical protein